MRCLSHLIFTVVWIVGVCSLCPVKGQPLPDFSLINERASFGPVVLDDVNAYCYWPKTVVTESAVSAVELATGRHLWTIPAKFAIPVTFRIQEGWLQYETTESEHVSFRRSTGPRTFNLVNTATGEQRVYPIDPEMQSNVDGTWVHRDRCLTHQGIFVRCSDGHVLGNLGPGEHQTIVSGEHFLATTLVSDETNTRFVKRFLRKFHLENMQLEREIELPLEVPWQVVAARGELVIGRTHISEREPFLVCMDLSTHEERWRVAVPISIRTTPAEWTNDSQLTLSMSAHGLIRPVQVDLATGKLSPDMDWRDPRLLLSWYQEAGQYPDYLAYNENYLVGRWRFIQLTCIDARTGALIWNHETSNRLISRIYSAEPDLNQHLVAESREGFDIITVATGDRTPVTVRDVGLEAVPFKPATDDVGDAASTIHSALSSPTDEWLWGHGLMFGPLIPVAGWILWSVTRR